MIEVEGSFDMMGIWGVWEVLMNKWMISMYIINGVEWTGYYTDGTVQSSLGFEFAGWWLCARPRYEPWYHGRACMEGKRWSEQLSFVPSFSCNTQMDGLKSPAHSCYIKAAKGRVTLVESSEAFWQGSFVYQNTYRTPVIHKLSLGRFSRLATKQYKKQSLWHDTHQFQRKKTKNKNMELNLWTINRGNY